MFTKTIRTRLAAAMAFGSLAVAAPVMAAPVSRDAGLQQGSADVVTVQYGYGHRHGGWGHHGGYGPRHHHHGGWGPGRGHHRGWGHGGFGRHHHHGGWGHRHGHGRW